MSFKFEYLPTILLFDTTTQGREQHFSDIFSQPIKQAREQPPSNTIDRRRDQRWNKVCNHPKEQPACVRDKGLDHYHLKNEICVDYTFNCLSMYNMIQEITLSLNRKH